MTGKVKAFSVLAVACFISQLKADVTGSIVGAVRDSSNAPVVGAHVIATNTSTNFKKEANSDALGEFSLLALPPGPYQVTATAKGFDQFVFTGIDLKVNDRLHVDVSLKLGTVKELVTVEASSVQVETENTQLGQVFESKQILSLPLNGRSYIDLLSLQAGVAPTTSGSIQQDRPVSGISSAGNVSVNGQRETANAFLVNGGDVSEGRNLGAGLIPNLDSIQEFRLITNSFDAEYGKFSGSIMNAITKSGSNSFHGDGFEFLRNDNFDARNFFDPSKAELRRNQFGYAVGGPFWRNKLFWFTDYQGTRQTQGASTGLVAVPTVAERSGQFDRPPSLTAMVIRPRYRVLTGRVFCRSVWVIRSKMASNIVRQAVNPRPSAFSREVAFPRVLSQRPLSTFFRISLCQTRQMATTRIQAKRIE